MESHQGIFYLITFTGFLNGRPSVHQLANGETQVEFFVKTALNSNSLHRIFVGIGEAEKLLSSGYPGVKLFLEGHVINYCMVTENNETYIIPEILAQKIWFLNPPEPEKAITEKINENDFFKKTTGVFKTSESRHYTLH